MLRSGTYRGGALSRVESEPIARGTFLTFTYELGFIARTLQEWEIYDTVGRLRDRFESEIAGSARLLTWGFTSDYAQVIFSVETLTGEDPPTGLGLAPIIAGLLTISWFKTAFAVALAAAAGYLFYLFAPTLVELAAEIRNVPRETIPVALNLIRLLPAAAIAYAVYLLLDVGAKWRR